MDSDMLYCAKVPPPLYDDMTGAGAPILEHLSNIFYFGFCLTFWLSMFRCCEQGSIISWKFDLSNCKAVQSDLSV